MGDMAMTVDLVVIGAGPGGCAAALRGAELGLDVALVDVFESPGGNYLYNTCVPSETSFEFMRRVNDADTVINPTNKNNLDLQHLLTRKAGVIDAISTNLSKACKEAGVLYIKGKAYFDDSTTIRLKDSEVNRLSCNYAIIATGSSPTPFLADKPYSGKNILTPSQVLKTNNIPDSLLVIGAGHTGLELGYLYSSLGSKVEIIDNNDSLLPFLGKDIITHLKATYPDFFRVIHLSHHATAVSETENGVEVTMRHGDGTIKKSYRQVIVANGCMPMSNNLGLENTTVTLDNNGFIATESTQKTNDPNIFAVGDVTNSTMHSNLAEHQGKVAAEVISGLPSVFDARAIPCTLNAFESISWCGILEHEAAEKNIAATVYWLSWKELPHSIIARQENGLTQVIVSADDNRVLGAVVVGPGSADLITEAVLAIEMGALIEDLLLTLRPHPGFTELLSKRSLLLS